MAVIHESGVDFGDFDANALFHIEESPYVLSKNGIKSCEFIWLRQDKNTLFFVEAKSSSPNPRNIKDFEKYIMDIIEKFANSVQLLGFGALGKLAPVNEELSEEIKKLTWDEVEFRLLLVIPRYSGKYAQYLPPLTDKLQKQMRTKCYLWGISPQKIAAINVEQAKRFGLVL